MVCRGTRGFSFPLPCSTFSWPQMTMGCIAPLGFHVHWCVPPLIRQITSSRIVLHWKMIWYGGGWSLFFPHTAFLTQIGSMYLLKTLFPATPVSLAWTKVELEELRFYLGTNLTSSLTLLLSWSLPETSESYRWPGSWKQKKECKMSHPVEMHLIGIGNSDCRIWVSWIQESGFCCL